MKRDKYFISLVFWPRAGFFFFFFVPEPLTKLFIEDIELQISFSNEGSKMQ